MNNTDILFLAQECPFNYQCKAVDCLECAEIHVDSSAEVDTDG